MYKILIFPCLAESIISLFCSGVCSLLIHSAEIPSDFNFLTWSRIKAIRGENITVVPGNTTAGN